MKQKEFRAILQQTYLKKRGLNPSYSLRAFAKSLKVDPGSLSQFLNGRRNYGLKKLNQIGLQLGMSNEEVELLLSDDDKDRFKLLNYEDFSLLSKWYYVALIECMGLDDFEPSPKWISEKIGVSISVVNVAINQLFSRGILSVQEDGSWKNNWSEFTTQKNENVDEEPLKLLQKQLLEKASESIDENHAEEKSHTAYISAIDSDLVEEIKQEVKIFRRKIAKLIDEKSKKRDVVYCLQLNLFPQTKKSNEGER